MARTITITMLDSVEDSTITLTKEDGVTKVFKIGGLQVEAITALLLSLAIDVATGNAEVVEDTVEA